MSKNGSSKKSSGLRSHKKDLAKQVVFASQGLSVSLTGTLSAAAGFRVN